MDSDEMLMMDVIVAQHDLLVSLCRAVRDYLDDPDPIFGQGLRQRLDKIQAASQVSLADYLERLA